MNLYKNLLSKIKWGQAKCVQLYTRGEEGSTFGDFCARILCG